MAHLLAQQDPFQAWLPRIEEYEDGDEYARSKKEPYTPWIVWPSAEVKLDGTDPIGAKSVVPCFSVLIPLYFCRGAM